jgi:hypothetical protein
MKISLTNNLVTKGLLTLIISLAGFSFAVIAHEGHSHDDAPKSQNQGIAYPTLVAVSENYELVAVIQSGQMTIFLDQFESNNPIVDAQLEFDFSGTSIKASANPDGSYSATIPKNIDLKNGMPVTITISASAGSDLLVGELMIPIANAHESHLLFWSLVSLLIVISIAVIGWFIFRKNPIFFDQSKKLVLTLLQRIQK